MILVLTNFNPEVLTRYLCMVLDYDCYDGILLVTRAFLGHFWGLWSLLLLEHTFNLARVFKWTIMTVLIGDWCIVEKWPNNYYPATDIDWWVFVLYGIDEYLDAVRLWWQWGLDVKIFSGIIKPASSGSMEQYKYFYI